MTAMIRAAIPAAILALASTLTACSDTGAAETVEPDQHEAAEADFERGPHRGRMLRDGDFALEITIFEDGVPPEFHIYPYRNDQPIDPGEVGLTIELSRLGGQVDRFAFAPEADYLNGDGIVVEPHSFDVAVEASAGGRTHAWSYASYEGRTTIDQGQADAAGVAVERAGSAMIEKTVTLSGRVELQPHGRAEVTAWFPGRIVEMTKSIGETVEQGELLARVISNESLQTYDIQAPIAGVVMARNANVGDVAGATPLYLIADAREVHAEFYVYPRDAARLQVGLPVAIRSLDGEAVAHEAIEVILPTTDMLTQTAVAHVELPNPNLVWRPGQAVEGEVVVATNEAPLAVRTRALQRFRDFTVVYARVGETYEVRMLELGRQTPEWTEVLGGLEPGTEYVSENAFLIRADVEKSGASHDH
jgi:cobalt-zinc-cadmium efflux system membrane fusion protein